MSDTTIEPDDDQPSDIHVRAGEYVLGVLDRAEAAEIRREAMVNLALADAIVRWEVRLAALAPPSASTPPAELWSRIEASVAAEPATVVPLRRPGRTVPSLADAAQTTRAGGAPPVRPGGVLARPGFWRATTVAALALAAAFAALAFVPRQPQIAQVAALVPKDAPAPAFLAQVRADGTVLVTALAPAAIPTNRDLQLWLVAPGAARPVSLGLLPSSGRTVLLPGPQPEGTQLLVSLEPQGGSPTGLPTGPVLYGGALRGS